MKTGDLIDLLAQDAGPAPPGYAWRRLSLALAAGGAAALLAVVFWLRCQPLLAAVEQPWFWMKAIYTGLLAVAGALLVRRLATPGASLRAAPVAILAVIVLMAVLGAAQVLQAAPAERLAVVLGNTWRVCSRLILTLSVPIYAALVLAVRALAPVNLTRAGAAAGFAAGALAATVYGLHCPEQGAAFVVVWYSLGIAAATALGALTGRWLLRW
jgi:hypothetical protein